MLLYARTSSVFRRCILTSRKGCIPFRKGDNMNTINATRTSATKFNTKIHGGAGTYGCGHTRYVTDPIRLHPYPGLSITLLTVPVAVGAIILGICRRFNLWSDIRTYKLLSVLRWRRNGNCSSRN